MPRPMLLRCGDTLDMAPQPLTGRTLPCTLALRRDAMMRAPDCAPAGPPKAYRRRAANSI